jgi:predicted glycoside hydrolase/deacetylase ChbG (UPF0249 family)
VLSHASLLATASHAEAAIELACQMPSLSVGVHLHLVDGAPCLPPRTVPTLVDREGRFRRGPGSLVRDAVLGRIGLDEVEREWRAQIEFLLERQVRPTHLDSHKHVHMWPPLFAIVVRLAVDYRIPTVRLAYERPGMALLREAWSTAGDRRQAFGNLRLAPLAHADANLVARARLEAPNFLGLVKTGELGITALRRMLRRVPPGRSELMTHPGHLDDDLQALGTRLLESREHELALLTSAALRVLLRDEGITLARRSPASLLDGARVDGRPCCES